MCLNRITNHYKDSNGYGYKVFGYAQNAKELSLLFRNLNGKRTVIKGKWLYAECVDINQESKYQETYKSGFHIFRSKKDAEIYVDTFYFSYSHFVFKFLVIKKVKFRKVITSGSEGNHEVIVAKEMKIL